MRHALIFLILVGLVGSASAVHLGQNTPHTIQSLGLKNCIAVDLVAKTTAGNITTTCHDTESNSLVLLVESNFSSTILVDIPKKMIYSLVSIDCKTSNDFFVLVNGEEVERHITENPDVNSVQVGVPEGSSIVEIIGSTIIPSPSPDQYCGIVEGYEKQYLAPLDQTQRGVGAQYVKCNDGRVFAQKLDGTPACVSPQSTDVLVNRGWAKPYQCTNTLFAVPGKDTSSCFCKSEEKFFKGAYGLEKNSPLKITTQNIITINEQAGFSVEIFNPTNESHYMRVYAYCQE